MARYLRRLIAILDPILPRKTRRLICAMAAHAMLARRGYGSTLSLGADTSQPAITAHAWWCAASIIVTGRETMAGYREVARFWDALNKAQTKIAQQATQSSILEHLRIGAVKQIASR